MSQFNLDRESIKEDTIVLDPFPGPFVALLGSGSGFRICSLEQVIADVLNLPQVNLKGQRTQKIHTSLQFAE